MPIALDAHADDNRRILEATGIDTQRAAGVLACLLPAIGAVAWLDAKTQSCGLRVADRVGGLTRGRVCLFWLGALCLLATLERGAARFIQASSWLGFERAVPQLLGAIGPAEGVQASIRVVPRPPRTPTSLASAVALLDIPQTPPGDIFFFVVDSLRGDVVNATLTPALAALAAESLPVEVTLSGGNATHLGWHSLFWADSALGWRLEHSADTARGPVPLQLARRRGWRIEVLSTPDLQYMNQDRAILGEGNELADSVLDLHDKAGASGTKDSQVVDK